MVLAGMLLASLGMEAKSMKDLLVSMPDSLAPSLDKNLRTEFVELQDMGVKAEVNNLLGGSSVMDTLTQNFVQLRLSAASTMQIKKLPQVNGDSLLCVVKTLSAPEKESEVMFFNQRWQPLDAHSFFGDKDLEAIRASLIQRPDTMTEVRYQKLRSMIEPRMMGAILFEHDNSIVFRLSVPLLSADEKKQVNAIKVQRKFNWNGKIFNES